MKPYIISFMMSSLDGRIQSHNWGYKNTAKIYEGHGAKIKADGWIVGRVTMQEFSSKKPFRPKAGKFPAAKTDYIAPIISKTFAIGIDPLGKCHWESNMVDTEQVITVLTEQVSPAYLAHLREKKVSYLFGGKTEIDIPKVLAKLAKHFPIKKLMLQGGGGVNGSFLKAGVIDELRLLFIPVVDGTIGTPTTFDAERGPSKRMAGKFKLRSVKALKKGFVLLKYKAV